MVIDPKVFSSFQVIPLIHVCSFVFSSHHSDDPSALVVPRAVIPKARPIVGQVAKIIFGHAGEYIEFVNY